MVKYIFMLASVDLVR